MINKIIIFLIRVKLGLKNKQNFYFKNQANKHVRYGFYGEQLIRIHDSKGIRDSNINLNFLLSEEAKKLIVKC